MKTVKLIALAVLLTVGVAGVYAQAQSACSNCTDKTASQPYYPGLIGGPGIVTSESAAPEQLPAEAQKFLQTYYSRVMVGPINHNLIKETYKVELGNGVKITFDNKGKVEDIYSPDSEPLYTPAIKAVLPEKTYKHLEQAGLLYEVTGIKNAQGKGLSIQLLNAMPPEILFDVDGAFVILDY